MSLHAGKQITDNLCLVRLIGRGAMGSVWLADHSGLQSQVAVKFMTPAQLEDETSVQRFQQEAKAAAEIRSPHVVQVFDHGVTDEGLPFIVMELLEGESLDKRIKTGGAMDPIEAAKIVLQACKALGKAHGRGIAHRDIKPANVFLIDSGGEAFVKVLDFGVAKFSGAEAINMTAAGNMVGTPAFMSPEQLFHGKEVDHRGDLWSLAVVAYFALTAQRPFEGATLGELCVAIKRGLFTMPSEIRGDLGPDLDAWFVRAFHPDLAARFVTAKEMAVELERAVGLSTVMQSTPSGVITSLHLATYSGTALPGVNAAREATAPRRWPVVAVVVAMFGLGMGGAALVMGGGQRPGATGAASGQPASGGGGPAVSGEPGAERAEPSAALPSAVATGDRDGVGGAPSASASAVASGTARVQHPKHVRHQSPPAAKSSHSTVEPPPSGQPPADERSERAAKALGI